MSEITNNTFDPQAARDEIAKLESAGNARTLEQNEELAHLYVSSAVFALENGAEDLKEIVPQFNKAADVLTNTLKQGEDDQIRRFLGNVYLHRAVAFNDFDEMDQAIESYGEALDTLKPLEDKLDGEAKYDIAGIRLNRGTIYHELGEFEKAKADLDESFIAFRAVEKIIPEMDTRYYMAKVSVVQGSLARDMGEPLNKIADLYNRSMRLLVELIDDGQIEHERELANVLMDRCMATYEDYRETEFADKTERFNKFGDVLVDVGRAIEILERIAQDGNEEAVVDLFTAITTQGAMLIDIEQYDGAFKSFDRAVRENAVFAESGNPILFNQYAAAIENRGFCLTNLGKFDSALADINQSITLRDKLQTAEFDLDKDTKGLFAAAQATAYANRANLYSTQGNAEQARKDREYGFSILKSLDNSRGDYSDIIEMFEGLLK
jgi:tetratricopeptide (TPR) repeat protein